MVLAKKAPFIQADKSINMEAWLTHISPHYSESAMQLIRNACITVQIASEQSATEFGVSCLQAGLTTAEILHNLEMDEECIASGILYYSVRSGDLTVDDLHEHFGNDIKKLVAGMEDMNELRLLPRANARYSDMRRHLDNLRKMLVAMVEDVRVVIIKLAEHVVYLRATRIFDEAERKLIAQATLDIYAPLANRLGIHQIKWQLEDLSFRYLEPDTYHDIASSLRTRRVERVQLVHEARELLSNAAQAAGIKNTEITGRAKHIYSIYKKMQRKHVGVEQIYDALAIRVLADNVEDCYAILSLVHELWQQIPKEFDDYIATPKTNGYQSIHTAVIGPGNKNLEVQIRTFNMHKEAELGLAAHWFYKQGGKKPTHEGRIAWLRQVLEWQQEVSHGHTTPLSPLEQQHIDERIYVFTPKGEIKDLPQGATALDFAYSIHSEVGHRCRGAKVNGIIEQLNYPLKTGDQVEVLTGKQPQPRRDWLNTHLGYLNTARARAKVLHWFKQQDFDKNTASGQQQLKAELKRLALENVDLAPIMKRFNFSNLDDLHAAIGCGDVRIAQIIGAIQSRLNASTPIEINTPRYTTQRKSSDIYIEGVGNLLTHSARCCTPLPGEAIIGFITRGRGVSIHRRDCTNILNASPASQARLVDVHWSEQTTQYYPTAIHIDAYDRRNLVRDITNILSQENINVIALHTVTNKIEHTAQISLTIEIDDLTRLSRVMDRLHKLPNIIEVRREQHG